MSGPAPSSSPRGILLCGYYGEHNLGDDALLEVLNKQLPRGWQPWITAHDPSAVQRIVPNGTVVNRRSLKSVLYSLKHVQVVVLGGGSLLQDSAAEFVIIFGRILHDRACLAQLLFEIGYFLIQILNYVIQIVKLAV